VDNGEPLDDGDDGDDQNDADVDDGCAESTVEVATVAVKNIRMKSYNKFKRTYQQVKCDRVYPLCLLFRTRTYTWVAQYHLCFAIPHLDNTKQC
jgi:hypothetical protein